MDKIWTEMYNAAKNVLHARRISDYVTCGEVAAAVRSKSGKIYTGVCIDTCSTLGICAERNAIFNMITNGEQEIDKVLCILPDGSNGAPCGACRELMVQLMAGNYHDIEILLDYSIEKAAELGCGALCFEGNINFYGKSGFTYASEYGIRYHGLPDGADASFFLCKELIPGYLAGITGEYGPPQGYFVSEEEAEIFDREFPPKVMLRLPGQFFS